MARLSVKVRFLLLLFSPELRFDLTLLAKNPFETSFEILALLHLSHLIGRLFNLSQLTELKLKNRF